MNFDVSAVQCKNFNSFSVNDLRLEFFLDEVEDSDFDPVSKSPIDVQTYNNTYQNGFLT